MALLCGSLINAVQSYGLLLIVLTSCNPVTANSGYVEKYRSNFLEPTMARLEIAEALGKSANDVLARVPNISRMMSTTYVTLVANIHNRIDNGPARYILYRYFMQSRRWSILKLEATTDNVYSSSNLPPHDILNDLPGVQHLTMLFEKFSAVFGGYSIQDIALLAAIVEDSEARTSEVLLQRAYRDRKISLTDNVSWARVEILLTRFTYIYFGFLHLPRYDSLASYIWMAATAAHGEILDKKKSLFSYSMVKSILEPLQRSYPSWQDVDCLEMKQQLLSMEDETDSGRVRISDFNAHRNRHNRSRFVETIDDLQAVQAIDVSSSEPRVIVSNYISGSHMCSHTNSNFYTFCCIKECDPLMMTLEKAIRSPLATPAEIIHFAETVGTSTVTVPRRLPESLITRLQDMAANNSYGKIPIHSRRFAQFLHHAYPKECSFPSRDYAWAPRNSSAILKNLKPWSQVDMTIKLVEFMKNHVATGDGSIPWIDVDVEIAPAAKIFNFYIRSVFFCIFAWALVIFVTDSLLKLRSAAAFSKSFLLLDHYSRSVINKKHNFY